MILVTLEQISQVLFVHRHDREWAYVKKSARSSGSIGQVILFLSRAIPLKIGPMSSWSIGPSAIMPTRVLLTSPLPWRPRDPRPRLLPTSVRMYLERLINLFSPKDALCLYLLGAFHVPQ